MSKELLMLVHGPHSGLHGKEHEKEVIIKVGQKIYDYNKDKQGVVFSGHYIPSRQTALLFRDNLQNVTMPPNAFMQDLDMGSFLWSKKMMNQIRNVQENNDYAIFVMRGVHMKTLSHVHKVNDSQGLLGEFLTGIVLNIDESWKNISLKNLNNSKPTAIFTHSGFEPQ